MKPLEYTVPGLQLVSESYKLFKEEKATRKEFINPYLMFDSDDAMDIVELKELDESQVAIALSEISTSPEYFVLAGESVIFDSKSKEDKHFFVAKLYLKGLPNAYIYSCLISKNNELGKIVFVGNEPNKHLAFNTPEGEETSINALKMDAMDGFDTRTAFLIGHMDESRLWFDFRNFVADIYCKVGFDRSRKFEFVFEVSKFGEMTASMKDEFEFTKLFFNQKFKSFFPHIKAQMTLETASL